MGVYTPSARLSVRVSELFGAGSRWNIFPPSSRGRRYAPPVSWSEITLCQLGRAGNLYLSEKWNAWPPGASTSFWRSLLKWETSRGMFSLWCGMSSLMRCRWRGWYWRSRIAVSDSQVCPWVWEANQPQRSWENLTSFLVCYETWLQFSNAPMSLDSLIVDTATTAQDRSQLWIVWYNNIRGLRKERHLFKQLATDDWSSVDTKPSSLWMHGVSTVVK